MRKLLISVMFLACVIGMQAQEPFGFKRGMTKAQIVAVVGADNVKDKADGVLMVTAAPKPNEAFEAYILLVSPTEGLLKVAAFSTDIDTSDTGYELQKAFQDTAAVVIQKYGEPKKVVEACRGMGCSDSSYWMRSLFEKNRLLVTVWDRPMPSVSSIAVEAKAMSENKGWIAVSFEFDGFDAYMDSKTAKLNDSY